LEHPLLKLNCEVIGVVENQTRDTPPRADDMLNKTRYVLVWPFLSPSFYEPSKVDLELGLVLLVKVLERSLTTPFVLIKEHSLQLVECRSALAEDGTLERFEQVLIQPTRYGTLASFAVAVSPDS
jgi:hypothetical protein